MLRANPLPGSPLPPLLALLRALALGTALFIVVHVLVARALGVRGLRTLRTLEGGAPVPAARRQAIRGAGAFAVLLAAVLLCSAGASVRNVMLNRVRVFPGYPAAAAGLVDGDRVVALDGEAIDTFEQLRERVRARSDATAPAQLRVRRAEEERTVQVMPGADGRVGVGPMLEWVYEPGLPAVVQGVQLAFLAPFAWLEPLLYVGSDQPIRTLSGPIAQLSPEPPPVQWKLGVLGLELGLVWPLFAWFAVAGTLREERRARRAAAPAPPSTPS
jgi:PDZ domain